MLFMTNEVEYPSVIVSDKELKFNPEKTSFTERWPRPTSLIEVRGFLGLASFSRKFIKYFSQVAMPLTDLTKNGYSIQNWDQSCNTAMELLKISLTTSPV